LPGYLVAHGVVMTGWYLLFLLQAVLVWRGRSDLHRKLGLAGLALAALVVITGFIVNLNRIPRAQSLGSISGPEDLALGVSLSLDSMSSMVALAVLVGLAVLLRHRPQVHKRLMFWSMVWTLGPAFTGARPLGAFLDPLVAPWLPFFPADLLWLAALCVFDWRTLRRIHPATWIGFVGLALYFVFVNSWVAGNPALRAWLMAWVAQHPI
jgi:hypothetical protein